MLNKEDGRRLAQLERQLWRDDPDFCVRMTAGRPTRRRIPLILICVTVAVWTAALVLGAVGWWLAAAIAAGCALVTLLGIAFRYRLSRRAARRQA